MDARAKIETLVEVAGAGVRRGGRWLVEGVDLKIRRGEIVTLIGPNGSGKSTTAKMITGVLQARRRQRDPRGPTCASATCRRSSRSTGRCR